MKRPLINSGIVGLALAGLVLSGCDKKGAVDLSKVETGLKEIKDQNAKLAEQLTKLDEKLSKINSKPTPPPQPGAPDPALKYKVELDKTQIKGNPEALVTVVEWSDFQCPFCTRVESTIAQVQKDYGDKVRIAFKHNPLSFHKNALSAAIAAEAAARQGKFWEMHGKLFENQKELSEENYKKWAGELGLDVKKFEADLADPAVKTLVEDHQKQGNKLGARGTPAFFINGRFLSGAQPIDKFKEVIDAELKVAEELVAKGTPKAEVYAKVMETAKEKP
jgi:protein-disulfide isomerase